MDFSRQWHSKGFNLIKDDQHQDNKPINEKTIAERNFIHTTALGFRLVPFITINGEFPFLKIIALA